MAEKEQGQRTIDKHPLYSDQEGILAAKPRPQAVRLAYDGSDNLEYVGFAAIGSATSSSVWQIFKLTYSSGNLVSITWAGSNEKYDNVWDNRTSLTYG